MYGSFGLFIDGSWSGAPKGASTEITDPATNEVLGIVPAASIDDTNAAIAAAERAFQVWRKTPAWTRADLLHKVADVMAARAGEAARQITLETGKPLFGMGKVALNKGDTKGAIEAFNKVVEVDPTSPEAAQAKAVVDQLKK